MKKKKLSANSPGKDKLKKELKKKSSALKKLKREIKIEAALEKVRAKTMAMQRSDELADASLVLDTQIRALGIKTRGCAFNIYGENDSTEWFSSEKDGSLTTYKTPRENFFLRYYEAGQSGETIHIEEYAHEACAAHFEYMCTIPILGDDLNKLKQNGNSLPTRVIDHAVYFKYGYLLFVTLEPVPEDHDIFIRFAKTFEQTYTRFLDLKKSRSTSKGSRNTISIGESKSKNHGYAEK